MVSPSLVRHVAGALIVCSLGCVDVGRGPIASQDVASVHDAVLLQFEYSGPSLFVVNPSTPHEGGPVQPMNDETFEFLLRSGMDIDRALADRLAEVMRGPSELVGVPAGAARLRAWDGSSVSLGCSDFFYSLDGRQAAFVQVYSVAFSADGERALSFLDITCGPIECGAGFVVLLRREKIGWVLESQVLLWET